MTVHQIESDERRPDIKMTALVVTTLRERS
jgi:hypothetical protein